MTPEQQVRQEIDLVLSAAARHVCRVTGANIHATCFVRVPQCSRVRVNEYSVSLISGPEGRAGGEYYTLHRVPKLLAKMLSRLCRPAGQSQSGGQFCGLAKQ